MKHNPVKEDFPKIPISIDGFTKIIQLEEDVVEITDQDGVSVFATHCQISSCGQPMFSRRLRVFYVCIECAKAAARERQRIEIRTDTRFCVCGNEFKWTSTHPNKRFCSAQCCWKAAWGKRSLR